MLRLPRLRHVLPPSAREAARIVAASGGRAMLIAGGTDLVPNLKRRQFDVDTLVQVPHLGSAQQDASGFQLPATLTLAAASAHPGLMALLPGYAEACGLVSSPPLREAGTVGGNLLVDTRCNYYNQTHDWRRAIGFCMKKDGDICLVAPGSPRCWAISSSDSAPMVIALDGWVTLAGPDGDREVPARALYRDDGMDYLTKAPHEVITGLRLPATAGLGTAYEKLRRRGSIDFPLAGVAVALTLDGESVRTASIVLSGVGSWPVVAEAASAFLAGRTLDEETLLETAELAAKPAKPLDNADLTHFWRKRMLRSLIRSALQRAGARAASSPVQ